MTACSVQRNVDCNIKGPPDQVSSRPLGISTFLDGFVQVNATFSLLVHATWHFWIFFGTPCFESTSSAINKNDAITCI